MDFGKVNNPNTVDLSLPGDHKETIALLSNCPGDSFDAQDRVFVGGAKWGRDDWVGMLYPQNAIKSRYLTYYAKSFNSVELNATFHRMPESAQMNTWSHQVPEHFLFCPKLHKDISHGPGFFGSNDSIRQFLAAIKGLGKHLGPLFLQLPPHYGPEKIDVLKTFLDRFPVQDFPLFVEFRHPAWFLNSSVFDRTFSMLKERKIGAIITDAPGRRDILHQRLTTSEAFIRFVGSNLHSTDFQRLDDWAERIKKWMDQGLHRIYFFLHQPNEVHTPKLASYFLPLLNEKCGLNLPEPKLQQDSPFLF